MSAVLIISRNVSSFHSFKMPTPASSECSAKLLYNLFTVGPIFYSNLEDIIHFQFNLAYRLNQSFNYLVTLRDIQSKNCFFFAAFILFAISSQQFHNTGFDPNWAVVPPTLAKRNKSADIYFGSFPSGVNNNS